MAASVAKGSKPATRKISSHPTSVSADEPAGRDAAAGPVVFTIGHSTRPIEEFIAMLQGHGVRRLVDVRTVPRSRHNPQFAQENLPGHLQAAGIAYEHRAGLGGFRRTSDDSPNKGWRNTSFRGYADYMQTDAFEHELQWLMDTARGEQVATMCAEAVPWRCHRSLIADALLVHGMRCEEIVSAQRSQARKLTPFARVHGQRITYPPPDPAAAAGV